MTRCVLKPPVGKQSPLVLSLHHAGRRDTLRGLLVLAATALALKTVSAQLAVQGRKFPEKVQYGELLVVLPPLVKLDGKDDRLAPGARIYGINNLLVLSATLVKTPVKVAYLRDSYGLLHQVWILTDAEKLKAKFN